MKKLPVITIDAIENKMPFNEIKREVEFFIREGVLHCADVDAVDYYGEYRREGMYIHPKLEEYAAKLDMYWEWENCECITLHKI